MPPGLDVRGNGGDSRAPRPRVVITGGAGFIGSHLCERFLREGYEVTAIDSFLTGVQANVAHLAAAPGFRLAPGDVTRPLEVAGRVDLVLHFASPASPRDYLANPIHTMKVDSFGAFYTLGLVKAQGARYVLASTSEVYGDPLQHPQREEYWGNVNPVGLRSVYDEAKRFAEALAIAYHRAHAVDVRVARIFNTYGPRMRGHDGRAIPAFINAALRGRAVEVYGDGTQTRSFCYIDDLVEGVFRLATRPDLAGRVVNLGNDAECTLLDLAETVIRLTGSASRIVFRPLPQDDPRRRRPDLAMARRMLGYVPRIALDEGLRRTIAWFAANPRQAAAADERVMHAVHI
ncbi:MAG TPA: UDP-glucuronic acid decarboxylase family protein [bacterium]|nr:UDP-glucuronic acid decarboxylase family protein [bacterium]